MAVGRTGDQGAQDQHVERALHHLGICRFVGRHDAGPSTRMSRQEHHTPLERLWEGASEAERAAIPIRDHGGFLRRWDRVARGDELSFARLRTLLLIFALLAVCKGRKRFAECPSKMSTPRYSKGQSPRGSLVAARISVVIT